jgi:hypothetical protein
MPSFVSQVFPSTENGRSSKRKQPTPSNDFAAPIRSLSRSQKISTSSTASWRRPPHAGPSQVSWLSPSKSETALNLLGRPTASTPPLSTTASSDDLLKLYSHPTARGTQSMSSLPRFGPLPDDRPILPPIKPLSPIVEKRQLFPDRPDSALLSESVKTQTTLASVPSPEDCNYTFINSITCVTDAAEQCNHRRPLGTQRSCVVR